MLAVKVRNIPESAHLSKAERSRKFTEFKNRPSCSFTSKCLNEKSAKDFLLQFQCEASVSVAGGLVGASGSYSYSKTNKKESRKVSLMHSAVTKKGELTNTSYYGGVRSDATRINLHGKEMVVEGFEIGVEEILMVTLELISESEEVKEKLKLSLKVLFFSISTTIENLTRTANLCGSLQIHHYSTIRGGWRFIEFPCTAIKEGLKDVKRLEDRLLCLPRKVASTEFHQLPILCYLLRPQYGQHISLCCEHENCHRDLSLQLKKLQLQQELKTNLDVTYVKQLEQNVAKCQGLIKKLENLTLDRKSFVAMDKIYSQLSSVCA